MNDRWRLEAAAAWAYSSVVEHCVDIAGVASSILATPTTQKPRKPLFSGAFVYQKRKKSDAQLTCSLGVGPQVARSDLAINSGEAVRYIFNSWRTFCLQ